jgi:hypothetical protein
MRRKHLIPTWLSKVKIYPLEVMFKLNSSMPRKRWQRTGRRKRKYGNQDGWTLFMTSSMNEQ